MSRGVSQCSACSGCLGCLGVSRHFLVTGVPGCAWTLKTLLMTHVPGNTVTPRDTPRQAFFTHLQQFRLGIGVALGIVIGFAPMLFWMDCVMILLVRSCCAGSWPCHVLALKSSGIVRLCQSFISSPPSGPWAPATPAVSIASLKQHILCETRPYMESVASRPFRIRVTLTHRDPDLVRAQGTSRTLGPHRTSFLCFQRAPTLGQRIVRCRFEVLLLLAVIAMHPRHSENNGPRFAVRTRRGAAAPPMHGSRTLLSLSLSIYLSLSLSLSQLLMLGPSCSEGSRPSLLRSFPHVDSKGWRAFCF